MYTQCPDCQTRFRVTADALRAAHGTVRCGRCGSAFDALLRLSDTPPRPQPELAPLPLLLTAEDELLPLEEPYAKRLSEPFSEAFAETYVETLVEPSAEPTTEPSAESTVVVVDEGGIGEDITLEGERVQIEGTVEPDKAVSEEEYDFDATDQFEALHIPLSALPDEREAERELETLILRLQREFGPMATEAQGAVAARDDATAEYPVLGEPDPPAPAPDEQVQEIAVPEAIQPPAAIAGQPEREREAAPFAAPATPAPPQPAHAPSAPVDAQAEPVPTTASPASPVIVPVGERPLAARRWRPEPVELEEEAAPGRSVWRTLAWSVGSLLLIVALAGQLAHHYRQDLARDARLGPPLRTAYERLGIALPPATDLAALELRQWGEDARANGRLVVRARLTNRAGFSQPYPVLRLQFEDRFGSVVGKRDFDPAEYLEDPAKAAGPLAPGASGEAELVLVDPGIEAVGYRLDVCLRESPAVLRCAQAPG